MILSKPTIEEVNAIDLSYLKARITNDRALDFYNGVPGIEHYKFLAWASMQYDNVTISEIGTLDGTGALALAHNPNNTVDTYDVTAHPTHDFPSNVNRKIVKLGEFPEDVLKSPLIFYDAAHDGVQERWFLNELVRRGWKGVVIWDDIHLNAPMRKFWASVTQRKADYTDIGHGVMVDGYPAGTGITWLG